jgi:hypothetical protein
MQGGRYGQVARAKVTPCQPNSASLVAAKSRLSRASLAWRNLTDDQRAAWVAWAADNTIPDIFGNSQSMNGNQAHNSFAILRDTLDLGDDGNPPPPPTALVLSWQSVEWVFDDTNGLAILLTAPAPQDTLIAMHATPCATAAVVQRNTAYRLATVLTISQGDSSFAGYVLPPSGAPADANFNNCGLIFACYDRAANLIQRAALPVYEASAVSVPTMYPEPPPPPVPDLVAAGFGTDDCNGNFFRIADFAGRPQYQKATGMLVYYDDAADRYQMDFVPGSDKEEWFYSRAGDSEFGLWTADGLGGPPGGLTAPPV